MSKINWGSVSLKEAIGKKIVDIILFEDADGEELQILLDDGKQIEICLVENEDGTFIHVQTD